MVHRGKKKNKNKKLFSVAFEKLMKQDFFSKQKKKKNRAVLFMNLGLWIYRVKREGNGFRIFSTECLVSVTGSTSISIR